MRAAAGCPEQAQQRAQGPLQGGLLANLPATPEHGHQYLLIRGRARQHRHRPRQRAGKGAVAHLGRLQRAVATLLEFQPHPVRRVLRTRARLRRHVHLVDPEAAIGKAEFITDRYLGPFLLPHGLP
ncbi:hypothetical protein D9M68_591850 [compost metagenome]